MLTRLAGAKNVLPADANKGTRVGVRSLNLLNKFLSNSTFLSSHPISFSTPVGRHPLSGGGELGDEVEVVDGAKKDDEPKRNVVIKKIQNILCNLILDGLLVTFLIW